MPKLARIEVLSLLVGRKAIPTLGAKTFQGVSPGELPQYLKRSSPKPWSMIFLLAMHSPPPGRVGSTQDWFPRTSVGRGEKSQRKPRFTVSRLLTFQSSWTHGPT